MQNYVHVCMCDDTELHDEDSFPEISCSSVTSLFAYYPKAKLLYALQRLTNETGGGIFSRDGVIEVNKGQSEMLVH